jgi:hypothetical protein
VIPHDCFADEVAIDFPSVRRLVERMRTAFFAENPDGDVAEDAVVLPFEAPSSRRRPPAGGPPRSKPAS